MRYFDHHCLKFEIRLCVIAQISTMNAKGSKKIGEGSRKKLREDHDSDEPKKPKKFKTDKSERHVEFNTEEEERIGGKKNAPQVSQHAVHEEQAKDFTGKLLLLYY